jgi:hypothetical protein
MDQKTLKELEEFANRKGFLLTVLEEGERIANFEGGKYILEASEDGDAESASFKTETALRRFLEGFPDDPVWRASPIMQ